MSILINYGRKVYLLRCLSLFGDCLEKRIHIRKFSTRIGVVDEVLCCCCDQIVDETFHHLIMTCPAVE